MNESVPSLPATAAPQRESAESARAVLQGGQWFAALDPALQQWLLAHGSVRDLREGERLFLRGDPPCGLYAVVGGAIRATGVSLDGREALLTLIEAPQWFGEIALFDGRTRTHDAVAYSPTRLWHVPQGALSRLLAAEPARWHEFGLLLAGKLRMAFAALEQAALLTAPARVACRLVLIAEQYGERPGGEPRRIAVRQEELAAMVSLSRQTTNQILKDFEARGLARLSRGGIEVLDIAGLRAATRE